MAKTRLMYSPANQGFVFVFGDAPLRLEGEPMLYRNKKDALRAATKKGLVVDGKGFVQTVEGKSADFGEDATHRPSVLEGHRQRSFSPGTRVSVTHGSGVDSGKSGVIVDKSEVRTDGRGTPTNISGAYKPVDWKKEVAVRLDSGELITMYKNRLQPSQEVAGLEGGRAPKGTPRVGTRVRFEPSRASLQLYTRPPAIYEEGEVTTVPFPGGKKLHYFPGPGGGLLYVKWDKLGTMGVAPQDVVKLRKTQKEPESGDLEGLSKRDKLKELDSFTEGYIEAALWSSTDNADDSGGEPLDSNYDTMDITHEALDKMVADCKRFQEENAEVLAPFDSAQAGHDFWLNRNGHGAGFWDGDYPEPADKILSEASEKFGNVDLYVSGGKIHHS